MVPFNTRICRIHKAILSCPSRSLGKLWAMFALIIWTFSFLICKQTKENKNKSGNSPFVWNSPLWHQLRILCMFDENEGSQIGRESQEPTAQSARSALQNVT